MGTEKVGRLVLTTGIPQIVKYLLSASNDAEAPQRRQTTTDAPTFMRLSSPCVL